MNIDTFDLNLLRVFKAVYAERSVSRAADALGLSQSATSNALARMRSVCGDNLFVRTSDGMSPTAFADALAGPVRDALTGLAAAFSQTLAFDPALTDRTFRLLMSDAGEVLVLPKLIDRLQREAPRVKVETVKLPFDRYAAALESGEADLAIGSLPFIQGRFYQQQLFRDRYLFVSRRDHPDLREGVTLDTYLACQHIGISSGYADTLVEAALALERVRRNVHLKVTTYRVACAIVACTDLVSTLPAHAIAGRTDIDVKELPFRMPEAEVRQFWHHRYHADLASRWLRGLIAALFLEVAPRRDVQSDPLPT